MKNTPAVFLTSLAVSAISLTVPMPAATTVLDLFIGEDIAVQHVTEKNCESHQTTFETDGEKGHQEHDTAPDSERNKMLRQLPEQTNFIKAETAFSLISNISIFESETQF